MPMKDEFRELDRRYAIALAEHGRGPRGLIWPNSTDLAMRFSVLLGIVDWPQAGGRVRLLDLGCGTGLLLDHLATNDLLDRVEYTGVDVLETTLQHARARWPGHRFEARDVREHPFAADEFDCAIACGVFTNRWEATQDVFAARVADTLASLWPSVRGGLAFNVMSPHVDWQRDDLFHWPLDEAMAFCKQRLSRHVAMRMDYGLWEYSVFARREPRAGAAHRIPEEWPLP